MAVTIRNAIQAVVKDPKTSSDPHVRSAYQIARVIRTAFARVPISPVWSIDEDCRDTIFKIPGIITINTKGLNGTAFEWRHYGGPLALFRLCRYARIEILKDQVKPRQRFPSPTREVYQQGNPILQKIDQIPPDAMPVAVETLLDGSNSLGDGCGRRPM